VVSLRKAYSRASNSIAVQTTSENSFGNQTTLRLEALLEDIDCSRVSVFVAASPPALRFSISQIHAFHNTPGPTTVEICYLLSRSCGNYKRVVYKRLNSTAR
jgi:hypothetical protein